MYANDDSSTSGHAKIYGTTEDLLQAALDSSYDAKKFEDDAADMRARFNSGIAQAARKRNAVQSLQSRIPDELWCLVWHDLPLVDRLSITRVCHTWRAIAQDTPYLWRFLDLVVDLHNTECDCQQCVDDNRKSRMVMQTRRPTKTNIQFVKHALQLGQQAPIVLQVTDDSRFSNDDAYRLLGQMLSPHAHRIRAVHLHMVDNEIIDLLFDSVQSFPALRVLHLMCGDEPECQNELASSPLSAPLLEELVISSSVSWESAIPPSTTFAKLHTLRCPIWSAQDALQFLSVCPRLQRVRFDINSGVREPRVASADINKAQLLAGRIPEVALCGLKPSIEADYLDIFAIPEIKTLSLWYYKSTSPSLRAVQPLASHCVGDSVTCACAAVDGYTAYKIDVGLSKHRLIMQGTKREARQRTWQVLGAEIATELIIDFNLWPRLLKGDNVKPMAQVTMFSVLLWTAEDLATFLGSQSLRLDLFPGLYDILSHEQTATLVARAKDFISLNDTLKVRRNGRPHLGYPVVKSDYTPVVALNVNPKGISRFVVPLEYASLPCTIYRTCLLHLI